MDENGGTTGVRGPEARRLSDAALVTLAARGCPVAWQELVARFDGMLRSIAHRFRLNGSDAADVAQVTWLQLHRSIDRVREPERICGWLARTARHECLRAVRRRERPVDPADIEPPRSAPTSGPDPVERLIGQEEQVAVDVALQRQSPRCRELLHHLLWDEHGYEQIAREMAMPVGSIGPTRQRCLASLAREPEISAHLPVRP
jgi:RNA polymerase sigma factor (sigma-70 family)